VRRYGDGWNGAYLYVGDTTVTLATGGSGTATVCLEPGTYSPYACGGSYPSEVMWRVAGITGGAEDVCTDTTAGSSPGTFTVGAGTTLTVQVTVVSGTTQTFDDDNTK